MALKGLLRHPGGMNHVIHAAAVSDANRRPPVQLIAEISGTIGSRRSNVGMTPRETLLDIIVHGQDMAIPLRRQLEVPSKTAAITATQLWSYQATKKGRWMARVFRPVPYQSYRLIATDTEWSVGEGPEIRGPILSIVLLLTGRTASYADLGGPGAAALGATLGLTHSA